MQKAFRWCGTCPWKFISTGELLVKKVKGAINSQKYIKLLKEDVVPFIETNYKKNWVFQEDNARPYTSKNTKKIILL